MDRSTPFFIDGPLHISYLPGKSDTLVLSFAGMKRDAQAVSGDKMTGGAA